MMLTERKKRRTGRGEGYRPIERQKGETLKEVRTQAGWKAVWTARKRKLLDERMTASALVLS